MENIRLNDIVVVVGPSHSILQDATLLYASALVKTGKIFVVDPQSKSNLKTIYDMEKDLGEKVTGMGDIDSYLREIETLRDSGMVLSDIEWLGLNSGIQHINLPNLSVDVIIDHNTSVFIAGYFMEDVKRKEELIKTFKEYKRVLKPGGKVLLQTNEEYKPHRLDKLLSDVGFEVGHQIVDDVIKIRLDESVNLSNEKQNILYFLKKRTQEENGQQILKIKNDYASRNLYIAKKRK